MSGTPELLKDGDVPLATTFDFLINRFWFKLNKGFGVNRTPRTIDMIMRARHILASIINNKASEKYDEFKSKYEKSEITKEEFSALNNSLRNRLKIPSEVDKDTVGEVIDELDRWDMEQIMEEQKRESLELKKARIEIEQLNADIEKQKAINQKSIEDIHVLKEQLDQERNARLEKERKVYIRNFLWFCFCAVALIVGGIGLYIYGSIKNYVWAKVVSIIIELSTIIPVIFKGIMKKRPPEKKSD